MIQLLTYGDPAVLDSYHVSSDLACGLYEYFELYMYWCVVIVKVLFVIGEFFFLCINLHDFSLPNGSFKC